MSRILSLFTLLACVAFATLAASASAADPSASGAAAQRALERAQEALKPGPTTLSSGRDPGPQDATLALRDLAVALPSLTGADRRAGRDLLARPTDKDDRGYFGKEAKDSPTCDAQFCVHWTETGKNAPVSNQFLDDILEAMTQSYAVENTALGWKAAKSDGKLGARHGIGGDGQVDVYVTNLGRRLYGYASTDSDQKGKVRRHAYLVLDNNYVGFPTPPTESMQVTVAHEYNHILQFNYDTYEDVWLFEDTATWAEEKVYPAINDYLNYVDTFANRSQVPMTGSTIKIYAEAIWNHWLSSELSDDLIRNVWEVSPAEKHFAVDSYNRAIGSVDPASGFGQELGEFFADTSEWHSLPGLFPDATSYPDVKRSGMLGSKNVKTTLDNTAFRLYDVDPKPSGEYVLKVAAEPGTQTMVAMTGRVGPDGGPIYQATQYLPKGGKYTLNLVNNGYSRVTAMVANVDGRSKGFNRNGKRIYRSDGSAFKLRTTG